MERLQTQEQKIKAYNCQFDIDSYKRLSNLEGKISQSEYSQRFLSWHQETMLNLETNLGERFNAQMFEVNYPVIDGRIANPYRNKPFLDNIVEGQQHRRGEKEALNHNQKRELAEVIAFSEVECNILENPDINFINPSPPGGDYGSNFIDVFNLQEIEDNKFVRIRRFAVSTPLENHWQIAQKLTNNQLPQTILSEQDIKLKEAVIQTTKTDEEILSLYVPDNTALNLFEYEKLKAEYQPWATKYIEAIMNSSSLAKAENLYENGLKFADYRMGKDFDKTGSINPTTNYKQEDISLLNFLISTQTLRPVKTGCGIQGNSAPRDLISSTIYDFQSEFRISSESEDKSDFRCPGTKNGEPCTYTIKFGSGVRECPECGKKAVCV